MCLLTAMGDSGDSRRCSHYIPPASYSAKQPATGKARYAKWPSSPFRHRPASSNLSELSLGAYLLGSVPTAYIMVRSVTGRDIRRLGSRNVGALNTHQQMGTWCGIPALIVDAGKGVLAVLAPTWLRASHWTVFMTTAFVVARHKWPMFLGFRGGKEAAAILGVSLALVPVLT